MLLSRVCGECVINFQTAVKSWDGGDNTIDSSKMEGEGGRRERDLWDAELDKGKVRL